MSDSFRICFYNSNDSAYREIQVTGILHTERAAGTILYGVFCIYRAGRFQKRSAGTCSARYSRYIRLKTE